MYLCRPLLDPQFLFSDITEAITHLYPARIRPEISELATHASHRIPNMLWGWGCCWEWDAAPTSCHACSAPGGMGTLRQSGDHFSLCLCLSFPFSVFLSFFFLPSTCIYTHNPCVCVYTYISIYREYCRSLCADYISNFTYVRNKIKLCVDLAVGLHIHMYAHRSM